MKRKTLTLAISVFALLAIISVGFASWVITRQDQTAPVDGSITVDDVKDELLGISYDWVTDSTGSTVLVNGVGEKTNPVIVFGKPASNDDIDTTISTWLSPSDKIENLHAYLKISVANKSMLATKTVTISFKAVKSDGAEVVSNDYFALPDTTKVVDFKGNDTVVIDFAFNWGKVKFNSVNPLNVGAFWHGDYTDNKVNLANEALSGLYSALNGVTYTVTVAVTDK